MENILQIFLENWLHLVKHGNEIRRWKVIKCKWHTLWNQIIDFISKKTNWTNRLTELIVLDCHERLMHAGQRQTLTELWSRFAITKGNTYVKYLLNRCAICKRYTARPYSYPESWNLPSFRLDKSTPFSACRIDCIGPLYTKNVNV